MYRLVSYIFVWAVCIICCSNSQIFSADDIDALIDLYYKNEQERLEKIIPVYRPDPQLNIITASITVDDVPRDRPLEKEVLHISLQQRLFEFLADKLSFFDKTDDEGQELLKLLESSNGYREQVLKCEKEIRKPVCDAINPYRTHDGTCNNLKHPLWGSTHYCAIRFLPPHFEGSSQIRKSVMGVELPEPRTLTLSLNPDVSKPHVSSHFFTFFGEAITHDISLSPSQTINGSIDCCATPLLSECFPLNLPPLDTLNRNLNVTCQNFMRVGPCRTCSFGKRHHLMQVTSAIDISFMYGNTEERSKSLRRFDGTGQLQSRYMEAGEVMLQNKDVNATFCPKYMMPKCFYSGDGRVNQNSLITIFHVIFLRLHNNVVKELHRLNPLFDNEKLYQEGRRIVIGIYQNIIYREYLPLLFDFQWDILKDFGLLASKNISTYDETVEIGTLSEFGGSSFRLHSMLDNNVLIDGLKKERFRDMHINPDLIYEGYMDKIVVGTCKTSSQTFDRFVSKDTSQNTNKEPRSVLGLDLQSMDVQRGRDLGFQPYVQYVKLCSNGTIQIKSFEDLIKYNLSSVEDVWLLQQHYRSVEDIDLLLGMQFDSNLYIFRCINAHQFRIFKYGDRFFYTHGNLPTSFKHDQIGALFETSFASVICSTTSISKIQKRVFRLPSTENPIVPCSEIPKLNLLPWKV